MKAKFLGILMVVALLAMSVGAMSVSAMPPLQFSSSILVQNLEDELCNIVISFYDLDGDGTPIHQLHDTLEPFDSEYYFTTLYPLGVEWSGSAVVGADREVRVVNNLFTEDELYQGASNGYLEGAYEVGLPLIQASNKDWDTWFNVQNVGPDPALITVAFEPGLAGNSYTTQEIELAPFAAHTFDQRDMYAVLRDTTPITSDPDHLAFIGAATVTSVGSPVVATVVEGSNTGLLIYDGFTSSGTEGVLVAPLFHTNHVGYIGSIHVQNRGTVPTTVTINYTPSASVGMGTACYETYDIAPGAMEIYGLFAFGPDHATFTTSNCYPLNGLNAFVGSAYIDQSTDNSAAQPLVVEVQQFTNNSNFASAYNAYGFEDAAAKLACPEMQDRNSDIWTSINMFNASKVQTETVTINYYGRLENGNAETMTNLTQTFDLGPLEATTMIQGPGAGLYNFELGAGWVGSAIISANHSDAQLVSVVNVTGPGTGDALATYNSFPIKTVAP